MKVIDLLNKIANGEEVPKKINYQGKIFDFDELEKVYVTSNFDNTVMQGLDLYIDGLKEYSLNLEVEIIEEEPEIDIQGIKYLDGMILYNADDTTFKAIADINNKIGELIKAVKQLDNKIKEKE